MENKTREYFPDLTQVSGFTTNEEKYEPFAWYQHMRQNAPVYYDEGQDVWNVFKYDDVKRVAEDKDYFSNAVLLPDIIKDSLMGLDQPKHTLNRALINRAFTPKAVMSWIPKIDQIVADLMDAINGKPQIDIVQDFAFPLPMIIISELLGIPTEDSEKFRAWVSTLTVAPQDNTIEEYMRIAQIQAEASQQLIVYFQHIIEVKRARPEQDIISDLIQAEENGYRLSPEELMGSCVFLLIAGNETTTSLITNSIYSLNQNHLFRTLHTQPELIPTTVEEVLRYRAPVQRTIRKVSQNTVIGGKSLKAGDYIANWIGSANRDEDHFEQAELFIPNRRNNKHLSFGKGIHVCLGSQLARIEVKAALTALLQKYPNMRVSPNYQIDIAYSNIYSLKSLPVELGQST
ncbi:cytochrome P450 [Paenibacillus nicotianae]|uniref:Cytochrome P450 n=1 Tax=Paenibacillus nicotianae TaxID=1526551 RepID=A0ABW4UZ15_9BACL